MGSPMHLDAPKFSEFHVSAVPYKEVKGHKIQNYVLVPKSAPPGKRPIFVKIHGGFLFFGACLTPDWLPQYQLDLTIAHSAIFLSPAHRLMPEANGQDMLSDIADFWTWVRNDLASYLSKTTPGIEPDLDHILVAGASAGAYMAVQSVLLQPVVTFKALISAYPMLDVGSDWFNKKYPDKKVSGLEPFPSSILDDHLAAMKPNAVVTEVDPPERSILAIATVQQGRYGEILGKDPVLYPVETIMKVEEFPFMFVYHGVQDLAVPYEGTVKFVERVRERFGEDAVHMYTQPGGHGVDGETKDPWIQQGLKKVVKAWLG